METTNSKHASFFALLIATTLVFTILSSVFHLGWIAANIWAFSMYGLSLVFSILRKDNWLKLFLVFGTVAGFGELAADSWSVSNLQTLIYPQHGVFVWDSPLYMPFFWAYMLALLGYMAHKVIEKKGMRYTSIVFGLGGILVGPFIEYLANSAKWWYYRNTKNFLDTPIYIIGGEILLFVALPYFIRMIANNKQLVVPIGIIYAISFWFFYAITFYTFD